MKWESRKISEVCVVGDGAHASIKRLSKGVLYLTSKNFKPDGIDLSKVDFISLEDFKKHFKEKGNALTKPRENDLLLSIIGTLGAPYLVGNQDEFGLSSSVSILRPDVSKIWPKYLLYWIRSNEFQTSINNIKSGVAQSFLSLSMIKELPVRYPSDISIQQKIAAILSAYDDLIENNLRRIRLLEEAAQHLYREWFVEFRFPGWEEVEMVDGVPEGWEKCSFFEIAEVMSGGTPKTDRKDFWDGEIPFFTPKDGSGNNSIYINQTERRVTEEGLKNCNSRLYPKNTVFITARGTVGRICLAAVPMAMSQSSFALSGKDGIGPFFLCSALQNSVEKIKKFAIGGVFDTIIVDTFKKIECLKPTKELISLFERVVTPLFSQTETLHLQNQKLKEARDILLPRLMNQTIEVKFT